MLCEESTQYLKGLIKEEVLVPAKMERFEALFCGSRIKKCTCTSCADGDRIGLILERLYHTSGTRNIHPLTTHGGVLAIYPDTPLLVGRGYSNEIIKYHLEDIMLAQTELEKGKIHLSLMHFPCGAAKKVGLTALEQFQLYFTAIEYNLSVLEIDRKNFLTPVHIEWRRCIKSDQSEDGLYIFKKTPWIEYCKNRGIPPTLDVHAFNQKRFGTAVSFPVAA